MTYLEIETRIEELFNIIDNKRSKVEQLPDEKFGTYWKRILDEIEPEQIQLDLLYKQRSLIKPPVLTPLPKKRIGHLYSLEEFIEMRNDGDFIDYDGFGRYATDKEESDVEVMPSYIKDGFIRKDFSNVIWYNR